MKNAGIEIPELRDADKERFWAKVNKDGPLPDQSNPHYAGLDRCWEWTAAKEKRSGYGVFQLGKRALKAHRVSFFLANNKSPLPCGLHKCDNASCVNPGHVFSGTHSDNSADRERKNRGAIKKGDENISRTRPENLARGSRHGLSKLDERKAFQIRTMFSSGGFNLSELAVMFGVRKWTICKVVHRKSWRHVI